MKWTPSASGERSREAAGPEEEEDRERESKRESERAAMIRASVCSPWGDSDDKKEREALKNGKWKMVWSLILSLIVMIMKMKGQCHYYDYG